MRDILTKYGFDGANVPFIRGNAKAALDRPTDVAANGCIAELLGALDRAIPEPKREIDRPFLMPIEGVHTIEGRGTVATGKIEQGVVSVGQKVEIVGLGEILETVCTSVEAFNTPLAQGEAGWNVGLLLRGIKSDQIQRGQVIAAPRTIRPRRKFAGELYVLSKSEGGRHTPFFSGASGTAPTQLANLSTACYNECMRFLFLAASLAAYAFGLPLNGAFAHPVPRANHDRAIRVQLVAGEKPGELTVRVAYRLEVDELTVVLDDMKPFQDEVDYTKFKNRPLGYYAEYMNLYAPILARNLIVKLDGREVDFKCVQKTPTLKDEDGKDLGHLRCDFVFEAPATYPLKGPFKLSFRDGTFLLQEGDVRLSLDQAGPWFFDIEWAPTEELIKRPAIERRPGDDDKLREIKAEVRYYATRHADPPPPPPPAPPPPVESPTPQPEIDDAHSLLRLVQSDHTFWLMLLLAAAFGAAHALTPGHGKTLVAAYLVGQRGTVFHAIALGIISTLTHTWSVLALAGVVHWFGLSPSARAWIQSSLPLILGLMIVCFGFLLLLQRLAGRADHIHIGGGHHHHHDGHHHHHDPIPEGTQVTWGGLILLGVTGSIIPCWDAIAMLVWSIGADRLSWAVPLLLAFSAGLAAVLVTIGILVVKMRGFADRQFGDSRWVRALPIASAIAIIVLGFWLCRQAAK